jgi:ATP-dependent Clp protease adaptor protein ClpS
MPHLNTAAVLPETIDVPTSDDFPVDDHGWNVIVWNDPVNLMGYVVYVLRKLFGYSEEKATKLMLEVHNDGRSVVNMAPREKAEMDCYALQRHGLWATLGKA